MAGHERRHDVLQLIIEDNRRDNEKRFNTWCDYLLGLPTDLELKPKFGEVDIELQPLRWMTSGIDLIQSRKITAYVQLADGIQGPAISSYLPYPVFHMATELFLKGLWLCHYAECREITDSSYIDADKRDGYSSKLRSDELGHDLIQILSQVRTIPEYRSDPAAARFLELVDRIVRGYYFPPYVADKRTRWANSRYPKRVYDDVNRKAQAESYAQYPEAEWIEILFQRMEQDADRIWQLRAGLAARDADE
ncbi:MAG TPA: hypothetical protein VGW39_10185 [Chthoniobacterales bacterium]|nr:hypothetical protein [Chthoniobacterales bacterium]